MMFELKRGEVKLFEQKAFPPVVAQGYHSLRKILKSRTEVTGYKQTKFSSCVHTFNSLHTGSANCP